MQIFIFLFWFILLVVISLCIFGICGFGHHLSINNKENELKREMLTYQKKLMGAFVYDYEDERFIFKKDKEDIKDELKECTKYLNNYVSQYSAFIEQYKNRKVVPNLIAIPSIVFFSLLIILGTIFVIWATVNIL